MGIGAMTLESLITAAAAHTASDIHLRAGQLPLMRINGELVRSASTSALSADDLASIAKDLLTQAQHEELVAGRGEVEFAWEAACGVRCRASIFRQRGTTAVSLRLVASEPPVLETLGLPPAVAALAHESRGLVLVTGTTGSGKTTTLAALVNRINELRPCHILTIEDPIEFVHQDITAMISQREVGLDTVSYAAGLKGALRQDPDVILLGELRDLETIETALVAAETGHLVLSTLHTLDAPETINRIVSVFQPHHHGQVRLQLARVLRAAVSQRLLPRADGNGRVLAAEVLIGTPYIRDCIANRDKTGGIAAAIAAGNSEYGMQTFDQSIFQLTQQGLVTVEEAKGWVTNVEEFMMRLRGITPSAGNTPLPMTPAPGVTRFRN